MTSFVTGCTGFLGSHLVPALKATGEIVIGYLHDGHNQQRESMDHWAFGDLQDIGKLERILAEYDVDTVYHLAAQSEVGVATRDPAGTLTSNITGTWNLLEACRRQKVARVVIASSDKAYGDGKVPYVETQDLRPHGIYSTSKACADYIAQTFIREYGMSIAMTRCGNLYGPGHQNLSTLIPGTITRILRGETPIIRSGGEMRRDFLYVKDAVDGYMRLAESDYRGPMNFGSSKPQTVKGVVDLILKRMRCSFAPVIQLDRAQEIRDQWVNADLAAKVLGWTPAMAMEKGLEETIAWYTDHFANLVERNA